jgi:hypothetical protein
MKAVKTVASRLEITEEQAAELLSQIRVYGWEWTPTETWTFDSLSAGADATLDLIITGPSSQRRHPELSLGLIGPWSVTYSTDGGVTYQKSTYTGEVAVTVQ